MNEFATFVRKKDGMTDFPSSVKGVEELYKYKFIHRPRSGVDKTGIMKQNAN